MVKEDNWTILQRALEASRREATVVHEQRQAAELMKIPYSQVLRDTKEFLNETPFCDQLTNAIGTRTYVPSDDEG